MKYLIISIKFIFFTILLKSNFLSQEEKRIALVIGNSNYEKGVLKNPINDAKLISTTLQALNFEVLLHLDVESSRELKSAISEFGEKRPNYDVGFIFYAGHGIQVEGENYLLPINESYDTKYDVEDYGVSVQKILVTKHCESFKWDIPDIISDVSDIISFCKTNSSYILRMNTTTEMSEFSDLINTKYTGLYSEDEISNFKKELEELLN